MAGNNRICQTCGFRYGNHRVRDDACPKHNIDGIRLTFADDFIEGQFFKKKPGKKEKREALALRANATKED